MTKAQRFDLRLDSEELAALQRVSQVRGISASEWLRQVIRRAGGLRSIFDDEQLCTDIVRDDRPGDGGYR